MKKRIILSLTAIALSLSVGISLSHAAESSPAQIYVDQVMALDNEEMTDNVINGVQAKFFAVCQPTAATATVMVNPDLRVSPILSVQSEQCAYYQEILSLLRPMAPQFLENSSLGEE